MLADEGVKRVDMNGFIDNCGNYGADGIVGPHHEKREVIYHQAGVVSYSNQG